MSNDSPEIDEDFLQEFCIDISFRQDKVIGSFDTYDLPPRTSAKTNTVQKSAESLSELIVKLKESIKVEGESKVMKE
jgi:hypothetical protein